MQKIVDWLLWSNEPIIFIFGLAGLILFVVGCRWAWRHRTPKTKLKRAKKGDAHGILFGAKRGKIVYSGTDEEGHVAVFGGSGLGKTTAVEIPTLRSWTGTSFTIDISGDICKNVDCPYKLVYEPEKPDTTPYNVFGHIDWIREPYAQNEALERLALLLMPDNERMADAAKFFNTEGRKILTAALIAFYHAGMDFIPICEKIMRTPWKALFGEIDDTGNTEAIQYINSFEGANEANTAGCKQAADAAIKLFATNETIKRSMRRPRITQDGQEELAFSQVSVESYNVFCIVPDAKLKLYSPLLHLITAQLTEYLAARPETNTKTILLCLDEFVSLGHLEITESLRKLRKKHTRIMMLTQSMADIDLEYGREERMAMMNNFRFKIVLGADDTDTQEYFAKLIGHRKTKQYSVSTNANQTTTTESESREWVIEPENLAHLGEELVLLHPEGHMRLKKSYFYK